MKGYRIRGDTAPRIYEELVNPLSGYKCPHCGKLIVKFCIQADSVMFKRVSNGYRRDLIIECLSCHGSMLVVTLKEQLAYEPKIMSIHACEVDFKVEEETT